MAIFSGQKRALPTFILARAKKFVNFGQKPTLKVGNGHFFFKSGQAGTIEISTFSRPLVKNPLFFLINTEKKLNIYIDYEKKWAKWPEVVFANYTKPLMEVNRYEEFIFKT